LHGVADHWQQRQPALWQRDHLFHLAREEAGLLLAFFQIPNLDGASPVGYRNHNPTVRRDRPRRDHPALPGDGPDLLQGRQVQHLGLDLVGLEAE
jgi:hypothetical protein